MVQVQTTKDGVRVVAAGGVKLVDYGTTDTDEQLVALVERRVLMLTPEPRRYQPIEKDLDDFDEPRGRMRRR